MENLLLLFQFNTHQIFVLGQQNSPDRIMLHFRYLLRIAARQLILHPHQLLP